MKLIPLRVGITNIYLVIEGDHILLVDTGLPGRKDEILRAISSRGYRPDQVKLIFLTHSHIDHVGSAAQIRQATGARVVIHEADANYLEAGFMPVPKGTNPFFRFVSRLGNMPGVAGKFGSFEPLQADLTFHEKIQLHPFGFDATLIPTPGHTTGSSSLISKAFALVGDTMINMRGQIYPDFANDEPVLHKTWASLTSLQVDWYYPSHGKRISREKFLTAARKVGIQKEKGGS